MEEKRIIAYLEKRLPIKESQLISQQIESDTTFAAKVQDIKESLILTQLTGRNKVRQQMESWAIEDIETSSGEFKMKVNTDKIDASFLKKMEEWDKENLSDSTIETKSNKSTKLRTVWRKQLVNISIAATVLLLIGLFIFNNEVPTDRFVYQEEISRNSLTRGTSNNLNVLREAFKNKDFQTVITEGNKLLSTTQGGELINLHILLADAYHQLANYPEAINHLKKVTAMATNQVKLSAHLNIATLYVLNKEPEQALGYLQKVEREAKGKFGKEGDKKLEVRRKKLEDLIKK